MSPDQINEKHGKPSWRCNSCGATSGLEWWNGLSVAVCRGKPECRRIESEKYAVAVAAMEEAEAADREWFGSAP